ncbi:MAG: 23S rRNA pseudouridine(1911/1915/1917) synthase RluD [Pseudomonadota bacterium]
MTEIIAEAIVPADLAGQRLDQACAAVFPDYSRSRLKVWILAGRLTVNGQPARPKDPVYGGEALSLATELAPETDAEPQAVAFDVVREDAEFIVVAKPAGLVVHPGAGNPDRTLQNGLLHRYPELAELPRAGIVHRLDKDTSGLMVVARRLTALTELTRQLGAKTVRRDYLAVCNGVLTGGGSIDEPVGRHPTQRTRMAVVASGRPAVTHYRVVERFAAHTLLRCTLQTGRTHQIRVHLAHRRHPLVGDPLYGGRPRLPPAATEAVTAALRSFRRQALHAAELAFRHPASDETVSTELPPPADFSALVAALRSHASG